MLDGGLDPLYRSTLTAAAEPYERVDVWFDGQRVYEGLPFVSGSVSADLTSRVTRNLDLELDESWFPFEDTDLLAPWGTELRVYKGVRWGNGEPLYWPVFVGKIQDVDLVPGGGMSLTAADRANEVVENPFETPRNSLPGELVTDEMHRLIRDRLPGAQFGTDDVFPDRVPLLQWESEPGSALDEMGTALGAFWYAQADGQFVIRRYPWTVRRSPILTMRDGDGGTIIQAGANRSRARVRNVVTFTGERTDGTTPVTATDRDDDAASPTYVDGPFGRRGLIRRLNTPTTDAAARAGARAMRRRATAFVTTWGFTCVPDAALELGDVLRIDARGRKGVVQVVASMSVPLGATEPIMNVGCRAQVVDLLEDTDA